jgi:glucosamine-6-phosphate deaminase
MNLEILDDTIWADEVAATWVSRMADNPDARLCLPTGITPQPLYSAASGRIDLSAATVFLLDEFELPDGSPGRCDSMLQRDLLRSLARPPGAFHRLDVNANDPEEEIRRFDDLVGDGGLDLTLLGLGGNGHLGLNEPGSASNSRTRVADLASDTTIAASRYDSDARPVRGMTLGLDRILASKEIWLLVTGAHKATILDQVMNGSVSANVPASYLRNHPNVVVFSDRSAATAL